MSEPGTGPRGPAVEKHCIRPLATSDVNRQTPNCSVTLNRNSHRVTVRLNLLLLCLLAFIHHRIILLSYFPWTQLGFLLIFDVAVTLMKFPDRIYSQSEMPLFFAKLSSLSPQISSDIYVVPYKWSDLNFGRWYSCLRTLGMSRVLTVGLDLLCR